jgi:hypothetical protein
MRPPDSKAWAPFAGRAAPLRTVPVKRVNKTCNEASFSTVLSFESLLVRKLVKKVCIMRIYGCFLMKSLLWRLSADDWFLHENAAAMR